MTRNSVLARLLMAATLAVAVTASGGVREGMTRDELIELRGRPRASIAQDNFEYMEFEDGVQVELRDGRVIHTDGTDFPDDLSARDEAPDRPDWTLSEERMIRDGAIEFGNITFEADFDDPFVRLAMGLAIGIGILALLNLVAMWKFFTKAGEPGWAILIPVYNMIVMLRIAGKPAWWFLLLCIPLAQIVFAIDVDVCTARRFGKGVFFGLGLLFLPIICYPILAFGSATYDPAGA